MTLSFRKTRFSSIPQKTNISSLNQKVFIWHWSNPTHGEQTQKLRRTKPPSLQKEAPKHSKLNKMKRQRSMQQMKEHGKNPQDQNN